jgi:hypothetical protein
MQWVNCPQNQHGSSLITQELDRLANGDFLADTTSFRSSKLEKEYTFSSSQHTQEMSDEHVEGFEFHCSATCCHAVGARRNASQQADSAPARAASYCTS